MANNVVILGEEEALKQIITNNFSATNGHFEDSYTTSIKSYRFANCTQLKSVVFPNVVDVESNAFLKANRLTSVELGDDVVIKSQAFNRCYFLRTFDASKVHSIGSEAFLDCQLRKIVLSSECVCSADMINNSLIGTFDLTTNKSIPDFIWRNAKYLTSIIIRSETVRPLSGSHAFTSTPFANGVGWIYVPSNLVDSYKAATNWSAYASHIASIDEFPKPLQIETITDTWEQIVEACNNGTHASKYNVGDVKSVNIGGSYIPMRIVAMDADILANGNGTAPLTWLSTGNISTFAIKNSENWSTMFLREYLKDCVYEDIDPIVKNAIKEVTKTYAYSRNTHEINDKVWSPSHRELFGNSNNDTSYETSGVDYTAYFDSNAKRVFKIGTSTSPKHNWLRTSSRTVNEGGTPNYYSVYGSEYGCLLGFCT